VRDCRDFCTRRQLAFMCHRDEVVAQPERDEDVCCTGEERANSHVSPHRGARAVVYQTIAALTGGRAHKPRS
jgi:hypothetical protein